VETHLILDGGKCQDLNNSIDLAKVHGFSPDEESFDLKGRKVLLQKI